MIQDVREDLRQRPPASKHHAVRDDDHGVKRLTHSTPP